MHMFGELVHFSGRCAYFRLETSFQNFKTSSRDLGPLWQPGVYNDTKANRVYQGVLKRSATCPSLRLFCISEVIYSLVRLFLKTSLTRLSGHFC